MSYSDQIYGQWMWARVNSHPRETLAEANAVYDMEREAEAIAEEKAMEKPRAEYAAALAAAPTIDNYSRQIIYSPDGAWGGLYLADDFNKSNAIMRSMPQAPEPGDVILNWETDLPDHIVGTIDPDAEFNSGLGPVDATINALVEMRNRRGGD